jgi:hypothetical protein
MPQHMVEFLFVGVVVACIARWLYRSWDLRRCLQLLKAEHTVTVGHILPDICEGADAWAVFIASPAVAMLAGRNHSFEIVIHGMICPVCKQRDCSRRLADEAYENGWHCAAYTKGDNPAICVAISQRCGGPREIANAGLAIAGGGMKVLLHLTQQPQPKPVPAPST